MLESLYQRFAGSCMMLMHRGSEEAYFSGTGFLVHKAGYMLTAAENVEPADDLVAVPLQSMTGFVDVTMEEVVPLPLEQVRTDNEHGVALLKMSQEMDITVPYHILGNPERTEAAGTVMALGYPFGHNRLHHLASRQAALASKIESPAGHRMLLFDALVQDGDRGGPLIDARDERIIGTIVGRFDPVELRRAEHQKNAAVAPSLSFAISIEYGIALLEAEGVEVV